MSGAIPDGWRPATTLNSGVPDQLPVISRPREGAVFAGVCAGLARRLGVSAGVLRIVAVIAAIVFGWLGVALYAAGFLLLPRDGETVAPLPKAVPALQHWPRGLLAAAVIGVGVIATWATGVGPVLVPVMIIGLVLWFVAFRRHGRPVSIAAEPTPFERASQAWRVRLAEQNVPGFEQTASEPRWQQPYTDPTDRWVSDSAPLAPVARRRPRDWRLWGLAFALIGAFTGTVAVLDLTLGLTAGPLAYGGAVLAALGITGLVAVRSGRPPLLIPATIVAMVFVAVQVLPHPGPVGDYTATIRDETNLPANITRSAGDLDVDLSGLRLTQDRTLTIRVGAGDVTLRLPQNQRTTVNWQLGVGHVNGLGGSTSALAGAESLTTNPAATGPQLTITVIDGVGDLTVNP